MSDKPIQLSAVTREALASGRLAHLATINPDGTPQVTCIYVGWDGDELVAGHFADHVKLRNIRRDPRVTLSMESDVTFPGQVEGFSPYIVVKGLARVEEGGAVEVLRRNSHGTFPPEGQSYPEGFVTRIAPHHVSGTGPWGIAE
jgi:PPOX class probable F420-dependent enzyme